MKINFINSMFFLFCAFLNAQDIKLKTIDLPQTLVIQDFSFLKDELEGIQVVMLGENSHFDGNIFEMKTKLIQYLYQEMGFKTIAFESGIYDVWKAQNKIASGVKPKKAFENSLFSIWSKTEEFQKFVEFYDENKEDLKLFGFDNQITGNYGEKYLTSELYEYCKEYNLPITFKQSDFELLIQSLYNSNYFDEKDISYYQFKTTLTTLLNKIETKQHDDIHFYWYQIIKSILSLGKDKYFKKKEILSPFYVSANDNIRDKQMADNLLAYIKKHPNEKIICWGANSHFVNNMYSINTSILKGFVPMGSYVKKQLLNKVYSLALITAADSINLANKWEETPIDTLSFEYKLKSKNEPIVYISSNQQFMKTKQLNRLFSPIKFVESQLDLLHDGYLFLDTVKKATVIETGFEEIIENKFEESKNKITGRILDFETKTPIPFVNIFINQTDEGAISNVEGYFSLNIKNHAKKDILISALGYEAISYKSETLPKVIYLKTQSTVLDEIVIYGKIDPYTILKKAINSIKKNYPVNSFNITHYSNSNIKIEDSTLLDFEMVSNQYDRGYTNKNRCTQNIQEIKWNIEPKVKPKKIHTFFTYPNPIMNASFLKIKKYKKFIFKIENTIDYNGKEVYVMFFSTNRQHFNYTRRSNLSKYYGTIYINKNDYAVVKIIQNWDWNTSEAPFVLTKMYDNKYWPKKYNMIGYEQETCETTYLKEESGLYFLKSSQTIFLGKIKDVGNKTYNFTQKYSSYWYDIRLKDVERIHFKNETENIDKVKYNSSFWKNYVLPN
ncbi:MAG: erythromycin esterase family protein [Flavobacteriaceae bacterium]|nr:erythromycin esterase family protein [Flavobacteriaceae bacterium]